MVRLLFYSLLLLGIILTQPARSQQSSHSQPARSAFIALTGVTIIDANHPQGLKAQTILITGDSIQQIGPDGSIKIPDSAKTYALNGKFLLPGLIDTHVHLATDPSGTDNRQHTLETLQKMLQTGITTVRDMAGDARTLAGLARDTHTGDIIGPEIYYSALMAGPSFFKDPRTHTSSAGGIAGQMPYMQAITDTTDLVTAVARAKGTGATGIKLYAKLDGRLTAAIAKEAKRQNILVWSHAWLDPAKPSEIIAADVSSVSHACLLARDTPNAPIITLMKEHHTILDATLLTYKEWAREDTTHRHTYEQAKEYTAKAYKAGIPVTAGTDDDQTAFVQEEIKLLVTDAGFTPADAITAATLNGAKALGIENQYGTIQKGKKASLLILNQNPLTDINNIDSVFLVIKLGRPYQQPH